MCVCVCVCEGDSYFDVGRIKWRSGIWWFRWSVSDMKKRERERERERERAGGEFDLKPEGV